MDIKNPFEALDSLDLSKLKELHDTAESFRASEEIREKWNENMMQEFHAKYEQKEREQKAQQALIDSLPLQIDDFRLKMKSFEDQQRLGKWTVRGALAGIGALFVSIVALIVAIIALFR